MKKMMRARLLTALAAVAVGLVAISVAPTAASARTGLVVVKKRIVLIFPAPGTYTGLLSIVETKVERTATKGKHRPGYKEKRRAKIAAFEFCEDQMKKRQVRVLHLSKPPFLIGTDKPDDHRRYSVSGPEPPKGDPVKAFQLGASKRFRTGKKVRYRWRVECKGTQVTRPYPY